MKVQAFSGGGAGNVLDKENDVMAEELVVRGPQMFMPPVEDFKVREAALWPAVYAAQKNGMPPECVARWLQNLVTTTHVGTQEGLSGGTAGGCGANNDAAEVWCARGPR